MPAPLAHGSFDVTRLIPGQWSLLPTLLPAFVEVRTAGIPNRRVGFVEVILGWLRLGRAASPTFTSRASALAVAARGSGYQLSGVVWRLR